MGRGRRAGVCHMADTALFADKKLIGEYYKPDLILIPIGGRVVMTPEDAAHATNHLLKPRFAIPVHYGVFPTQNGTLAIEPGQELEF